VTQARVLWRRLDAPGHDACRLTRVAAGWRLEGSAVSLESGVPARLDYRVTCDRGWRSQRGRVRGWFGERAVALTVIRDAGGWTVNGERAPGLEDCVDLDLGFTPATNLLPIRRLALAVGEAAEPTAAWLDVSAGTLEPLSQRYERRTEDAFWYEAPRFGYAASLDVAASGFVRRYPGLWEMEA